MDYLKNALEVISAQDKEDKVLGFLQLLGMIFFIVGPAPFSWGGMIYYLWFAFENNHRTKEFKGIMLLICLLYSFADLIVRILLAV